MGFFLFRCASQVSFPLSSGSMPPLKVEYAKSGRSVCSLKECSKAIDKGAVRIGTGNLMPGMEQLSYKWRHLCCFTKRQLASVPSVDSIEGYDDLVPPDQALVRRMVKGELVGNAAVMVASPHANVVTAAPSPKKAHRAEPDDDEDAAPPRAAGSAGAAPAAVPTTAIAYEVGPSGKLICPFGDWCLKGDPKHFTDFLHRPGPPVEGSAQPAV